jgi:hypothetical protein
MSNESSLSPLDSLGPSGLVRSGLYVLRLSFDKLRIAPAHTKSGGSRPPAESVFVASTRPPDPTGEHEFP